MADVLKCVCGLPWESDSDKFGCWSCGSRVYVVTAKKMGRPRLDKAEKLTNVNLRLKHDLVRKIDRHGRQEKIGDRSKTIRSILTTHFIQAAIMCENAESLLQDKPNDK